MARGKSKGTSSWGSKPEANRSRLGTATGKSREGRGDAVWAWLSAGITELRPRLRQRSPPSWKRIISGRLYEKMTGLMTYRVGAHALVLLRGDGIGFHAQIRGLRLLAFHAFSCNVQITRVRFGRRGGSLDTLVFRRIGAQIEWGGGFFLRPFRRRLLSSFFRGSLKAQLRNV